MKKINLLFIAFVGIVCFLQSCDNSKTYAELKEEEADAINAWIAKNDYKIISEKDFYAQDTVTNENEYVLLEESGVYMNIMSLGPDGKEGQHLSDGYYDVLSHVVEIALQDRSELSMEAGDTLVVNMHIGYPQYEIFPEEYKLTISDNTYSASFLTARDYGMYYTYQSTVVPSGWLIPLKFLRPGRTQSSSKVARVRLIVPHSEGTANASRYVYPCYYELTYNLK